MNRRQAIAALTALPVVSQIAKADIRPADVIVVESDEYLSASAVEHIMNQIRGVWPDHKIVVLDRRLKMKIVSRSESIVSL
jgi:predicted GTPase